MVDVNNILSRFKQAKSRKSNWHDMYREAFEFFAPHRNIFDYTQKGQDLREASKNFDSTAPFALSSFVSNLQSALIPPKKRWMELIPGSQIQEEERDEKQRELDAITKTIFMNLDNSNFDAQAAAAFHDLGFGVGALMLNKGTKDNPFRFHAEHIANVYIEEGPEGLVDTVYREMCVPIRNIQRIWPDAVLPADAKSMMENKPNEEMKLIEATIPDKVTVYNKQTGGTETIDGFRYVVISQKTKDKIVEREQRSSPWIVFRWTGLPGEVYSRGPCIISLSDVKTINKVKELLLSKASLDTVGAYTVLDDGIMNADNIVIEPGALIPVDSNGGARGPTISALPVAGDLNLSQFLFNDLQVSINKMLFAEPIGRVDLPVKSATEIAVRQQDLSRLIGSAFGRIQYEFLIPIIKRMLFILDELDLIDIGGYTVDNQIIGIKYMSPLAQAQAEEDLMADVRYAQLMVGTFGPAIGLMFMNAQGFAKSASEKLKASSEIIPTPEELMQVQLMVQQMVAQMQAQQQAPPEQQQGVPQEGGF